MSPCLGDEAKKKLQINNMSVVFVPKKLRGKAKISQETIQQVRPVVSNV